MHVTSPAGRTGEAVLTFTATDFSGQSASKAITVSVVAATPKVGIRWPAGPTSALQLEGEPGSELELERSTDLQTWEPIGRHAVGADGRLLVPVTADGDAPAGFYRTRKN